MPISTTPRTHIALPVADLDASVAFYRSLFACAPSKTRPGYARFETEAPGLVLSLNLRADAAPLAGAHFGIRRDDPSVVQREAARLEAEGLAVQPELGTTCCFAVQDKAWVVDPDGNPWEIYAVLDDGAESYAPSTSGAAPSAAGCASRGCCS